VPLSKARKISISRSHIKHPIIRVEKEWKKLNQLDSSRKVVYFIRGNKAYRYERRKYCDGYSRILYIGQTYDRNGIRPIESLRNKIEECFASDKHITSLDIVYVTAPSRRKINVGEKLESACLDQFGEMFWSLPVGNRRESGKERIGTSEFAKKYAKFFDPKNVRQVLLQVGDPGR